MAGLDDAIVRFQDVIKCGSRGSANIFAFFVRGSACLLLEKLPDLQELSEMKQDVQLIKTRMKNASHVLDEEQRRKFRPKTESEFLEYMREERDSLLRTRTGEQEVKEWTRKNPWWTYSCHSAQFLDEMAVIVKELEKHKKTLEKVRKDQEQALKERGKLLHTWISLCNHD